MLSSRIYDFGRMNRDLGKLYNRLTTDRNGKAAKTYTDSVLIQTGFQGKDLLN